MMRLRGALFAFLLLSPGAMAQAPADYSALTAQSAALTPAQKTQAQQIFATAFTLWQSGDFASAEIAFRRGLDIDPGNGSANYYYGDCLQRKGDRKGARDYLARAAALGAGTAEGYKAQAQLQALAAIPPTAAEMTPEEYRAALIGHWRATTMYPGFENKTADLTITGFAGDVLQASGEWHTSGGYGYSSGTLTGTKLHLIFHQFISYPYWDVELTGPNEMKGTLESGGTVVMTKQ